MINLGFGYVVEIKPIAYRFYILLQLKLNLWTNIRFLETVGALHAASKLEIVSTNYSAASADLAMYTGCTG